MSTLFRKLSRVDELIDHFDRALRTLTPGSQVHSRPNPAKGIADTPLSNEQQRKAAGLMRVNHSGEVCAQALYQGQALTARLQEVRQDMEKAADEEIDHLAWCEDRLRQLGSRPSVLNPLWYSLSFGLGAAAGLVSDRASLGFVAATEDQVCAHLQDHLQDLPDNDFRSRAIVSAMLEDERTHGDRALAAGGTRFPAPIKWTMRATSKVMTSLSYHV